MSAHSLLGRLTAVTMAGALTRVALLLVLIPRIGVVGAAWAAAISTCIDEGIITFMALQHFHIRTSAFITRIVRPVIAAAAMAAGLVAIGSNPEGNVAWTLATDMAGGAALYATVLLATWLSVGRPEGAETEALKALRRAIWRFGVRKNPYDPERRSARKRQSGGASLNFWSTRSRTTTPENVLLSRIHDRIRVSPQVSAARLMSS